MDVDDLSSPVGGGCADPPRIRRLEELVVNRIAAGEVIQRPSSAVKELIENSLDAGASTVSVTVKDGGLKLIQVSDDGHGIQFEDLPILCERHTTSKLSAYEDLQTIKSMGFRGEALASMTYVGHVTVTTITAGQLHGYRVSYKDGVMENEPKPCAAVKGTQIMVENLFYNMVARRRTLQNSNDDYPKIVDFISRFAVHHINVSFSCRKHGANRADVHSASTSSRLDAIRNVYGASVVRDLMEIEVSDDNAGDAVFKMDGYISNANYVAKKITMILFINGRYTQKEHYQFFLGRHLEAGVAAASAKAPVQLEADPKAAATAGAVPPPPPQNVEEEAPRLQWEFVRKVYAVILLQYWLAGSILAVICFVPAVPRFFTSPHVAVYTAFIAVLVAPFIALWPMLKYREEHPVNLLLLGLVTLCFSLSIGILTSIFTTIGTTVLQSVILTEVAMINLIIYTFWAAIRSYKVTFLFPFLITHLLTFVVYMSIQVICPLGGINMTVFGCLATMLFVAFIIHDIVLLIKRHKYKEHIFAAISLYSDYINLALYCLSPSKSLVK